MDSYGGYGAGGGYGGGGGYLTGSQGFTSPGMGASPSVGGKGVCSYELDYKLCYLWSNTRIIFKMSAAWWSCQYHQSGDSLSGPLGCGKWREHI